MSPSVILSLTFGSIAGLLFHSVFGRKLWQLPLYWAAGVAGFFAGEILAVLGGVEFLQLGTIPLFGALVGTVVALFVCWFFSTPPRAARRPRAGARRRGGPPVREG